jgi:hypothetical protein
VVSFIFCLFCIVNQFTLFSKSPNLSPRLVPLPVQYDFLSTNIEMVVFASGQAHTYILFVLKVNSHLTPSVTV